MPELRRALTGQLPESIRADNEPVFAEPWQAQAFAMALSLLEAGHFTWQQWADTLGGEIRQAEEHGIASDGSGYYELWLRALEKLVDNRGLSSHEELERLAAQWRDAYASTPHGEPVTLTGDAQG